MKISFHTRFRSVSISFYCSKETESQKTQGLCAAYFATLSNGRMTRSKIVLLFNTDKKPCVRNSEGLTSSKILGILQTEFRNIIRLAINYFLIFLQLLGNKLNGLIYLAYKLEYTASLGI